jgi:hypothetical protein
MAPLHPSIRPPPSFIDAARTVPCTDRPGRNKRRLQNTHRRNRNDRDTSSNAERRQKKVPDLPRPGRSRRGRQATSAFVPPKFDRQIISSVFHTPTGAKPAGVFPRSYGIKPNSTLDQPKQITTHRLSARPISKPTSDAPPSIWAPVRGRCPSFFWLSRRAPSVRDERHDRMDKKNHHSCKHGQRDSFIDARAAKDCDAFHRLSPIRRQCKSPNMLSRCTASMNEALRA